MPPTDPFEAAEASGSAWKSGLPYGAHVSGNHANVKCRSVSAADRQNGGVLLNLDPVKGYTLITPDELQWRPSNIMQIPNADFLERTGSTLLGARLWRLPPQSANTLHKHVRSEEFYFVLEGTGRVRVGDQSLTVPRYGALLVGPQLLRQVFNDTDEDALWLIVGAPDAELEPHERKNSRSLIYPVDPKQLPPEMNGVIWPPEA
jgi:mannose-6-phosphate isomerase-like protein (cupin superfamily)